ncbi:MAG: sugar phosphate isomerase/epimerase [Saprospiraceae bacterium]|nr:MAG: sugar phosphate isomerase/epimerase [Saprospiraceae bacterium]
MKLNRRKFIGAAGAMAAGGMILPNWACANRQIGAGSNAADATATSKGTLTAFGLQLYTLRDDMPKDPKGVLRQAASFGYKQIEGYEGNLGLFWGMTNKELKAWCDDLGLDFVASHCNVKEDFETKVAQAAEIGMKYLVVPWIGPQKSMDDWKKIADGLNDYGRTAQKSGLRLAYHNHGYSFTAVEGQIPQDFLLQNTDPALVDFEMDIYWVVTGGADPLTYLQKYPNRFRLCHIKDRQKNAPAEEGNASCDLGTGSLDFAKILKVARDNGMQYYIVEQEKYDNSTPLKSAGVDAEYLKKLVFA